MASTFKTLAQNDSVSTKTLLHEAIPLTGTIVSGTYADENIKNYAHGMFQSVYDYPYLSSSANHIFDVTMGYASDSPLSASSGRTQQEKKINLYNQMAQVLVGYDKNGNIKKFDEDGDFVGSTDDKIKECFFLNFSRLLSKDEIKKGSFELEIGTTKGLSYLQATFADRIKITDFSGSDGYYVNSPAGEYGILYATQSAGENVLTSNRHYAVGLLYYQAGIAVLSGSIFNDSADGGVLSTTNGSVDLVTAAAEAGFNSITGSTIEVMSNGIRNRVSNIQFNNTTELNSTIYFCRANHNEFNYSANPTYLSGSSIRVKPTSDDEPVSYITTVGLYSADNQLLAVGKLSEPLRKDPTIELTLRTRLDY